MVNILTLPGVKGTFVAGLSWRHEDAVPKSQVLRAYSREKGRWGMVRKTSAGTIQVGFCEPVAGIKSPGQLKSLAAIVADQRPQPWMGLYKLSNDQYWYVAVRDGQEVIPDGDQLGALDDLLRVRDKHLSLGEWNEVEGTIDDLAEMVATTPRHLTLRDFQNRPWLPVALASAALVVVGTGALGIWLIHARRDEAERQAMLARQREIAAAQQEHRDAQSKILPWTREPMPSAAFDGCRGAWSTQPLAIGGWKLAAWHCQIQAQGLTIQTDWNRVGGLAAQSPGTLGSGAEHASQAVQKNLSFAAPSSLAAPEQMAQRAIWTLAQAHAMGLSLRAAPAARLLPGSDPAKPVTEPWSVTPATFTLSAPPWLGPSAQFDAVLGLRIEEIAWNGDTQQWTVLGTLYALREGVGKPPLQHVSSQVSSSLQGHK